MSKVDVRGMICPMPLIEMKRALKRWDDGGKKEPQMLLILDNVTAKENIESYLTDHQFSFVANEENGDFFIKIFLSEREHVEAESPLPQKVLSERETSSVILLTANVMGQGEEELGKILLQGFMNTLNSLEVPPASIIFYNSAVLLAVPDSSVAAALADLSQKGTRLLVCGTCVDYFNLEKSSLIGTISNMYEIVDLLMKATKIIRP